MPSRHEKDALQTIYRLAGMFSTNRDLEALVQHATDEATRLTGAQFGAFFYNVISPEGKSYTLYTISGVDREAFSAFPMPRKTEIFKPTYEGTRTVRYDDVTKEPHYGKSGPHYGMPEGHLEVRSYLAVPVMSHSGKPIGGLFFGHPEPGVFTEQSEMIAQAIAIQAGGAIDNIRLYNELAENEEKFRVLANSIPQLAWMADPEGWLFWYNQRWYDYSGTTFEDMQGWGWTKLHHPDHVDHVVESFRHSLQTGEPWEDTFPLLGRDGEWRWFLSRALPIRDASGKIVRWFGTNTDVTEKRQAEQALRQRELQLRQLADAMPQIVWIARPDGYTEHFNRRWYDYTGLSPEQSIGDIWDHVLHPEDHELCRKRWRQSVESGEPYEIEYRFRGARGGYRWFLGRAVPVRREDGSIGQWFGTCTDIHEKKLLEEQLRAEKERAEKASLAKSEFLANMSHEMRTPMNAVVGLSSLLQGANLDSQQAQEMISTLQLSAQQLMGLINDLLDISKLEAHHFTLEEVPFTLEEVITEVRSVNAVKAEEKGIALRCGGANGDLGCKVMGDPLRLRQVLMNVVGNAVKFTQEGEVVMAVTIAGEEESDRLQVEFTIRDTGIGIPKDKLETIFSKFSQADTSITRKYGGTGLGLSISKSLLELMDGSISVESKPGRGSCFTIRLPLRMVKQEATRSHTSRKVIPMRSNHSAFQGLDVLLVEDYPANVLVATSMLDAIGCRYDVADNGQEAVEKLKQKRYDIVFMDVQMPIMDGYDATRAIREHEAAGGLPHTPIIGMTANALTGDREKCLNAGMDGYISKPYRQEEIEEALEQLPRRAA